jgi:hypothetical protein
MEMVKKQRRAIVAEFHKDSGGRLKLFAMTVIKEENSRDGRVWIGRKEYDVEWSRKYGYIFDVSGSGGACVAIPVSGIYFVSGGVRVKENPTQLVDARDKPPWRGKRTKAIRQRNRTRRLLALPKAFELEADWDLLDWLEHNAINQPAVYCSVCRDWLPDTGYDFCEHVWWCDKTCWYSTPGERCKCKDRNECFADEVT